MSTFVEFVDVDALSEKAKHDILQNMVAAFPRAGVSALAFTPERRGQHSVAAVVWDISRDAVIGSAFLDKLAAFPDSMRVLGAFCVAERSRGNGVGAAILAAARERMGGNGLALYVDLDRGVAWKRLLSFYTRNGFSCVHDTSVVPFFEDVECLLVSAETSPAVIARM